MVSMAHFVNRLSVSLAASMGTVFATSVLVGLWLKEKDVKELLIMQPAAVTSSACLVVHAQPTTLASVFRPFMETTAPTPLSVCVLMVAHAMLTTPVTAHQVLVDTDAQ